jgi:D-threo-aldose 1-dehydrogenase
VSHAIPLPHKRLGSTSVDVTALGFGAAALGNLYRAISDDVARLTLESALDAGIGYVDTAPHYGQGLSERRVGAVLADRSTRPVISSKVGRVLKPVPASPPGTERHGFVDGDPYEPEFDYSYDGVMRSFEDSQKRLGSETIDILLAHDLGTETHGDEADRHMTAFLGGGYKAMRALKDQGLVKAIGLGVNEWPVCEQVMAHADIDAILLAGRYTLLEQTALTSFLPTCAAKNVSIILGGPYNSGILIEGIRTGVVAHYNYAPASPEIIARVEALQRVCAAHAVPLAAAALAFPLAHPSVACVIPGMATPEQVRSNLDLWQTQIPADLWDDLKTEALLHPDAPIPQLPNTSTLAQSVLI